MQLTSWGKNTIIYKIKFFTNWGLFHFKSTAANNLPFHTHLHKAPLHPFLPSYELHIDRVTHHRVGCCPVKHLFLGLNGL